MVGLGEELLDEAGADAAVPASYEDNGLRHLEWERFVLAMFAFVLV